MAVPKTKMKFAIPIKHAIVFAWPIFVACSPQQSVGLPPVEETRPSGDQRITEDIGNLSNGQPTPIHLTGTLETSVELTSDGLIGGMAIDQDGTIYAADLGSHIWKISPSGEAALFSDEFEDPSGNLVLGNGDILQSEWTNNRIYRISPDGSRTLFSEQNLNGPVGIVQRPSGDFIVANSRGKFLARVPAEGGDAEVILTDDRITQPNGVTIDPEGNVYIADLDSGNVFRWSVEGQVTSIVELPGRGNAHNVYANGYLYVTKIWDHAVYMVDPETGVYGLVSGNGRPGYADGVNGRSTVEEPNSIAVSPDGELLFNTHRGRMGRNQTAHMVIRKLRAEP